MALSQRIWLLGMLVIWIQSSVAFEEVHTLNFKYNNETVHSVVDFDAQENWMTHHVFATSDLIGATIAMDEETGYEVIRPEKDRMCYARSIPSHVRSVWDYKSLLEIEEEHNSTSFLPKITFKEFVGCTSKQIPIEKLGKVGYLCRGLPIYELETLKPPVQSTSSQKREKRAAHRLCYCCSACNCIYRQIDRARGLAKRELLAVELSNRLINLFNCPPNVKSDDPIKVKN